MAINFSSHDLSDDDSVACAAQLPGKVSMRVWWKLGQNLVSVVLKSLVSCNTHHKLTSPPLSLLNSLNPLKFQPPIWQYQSDTSHFLLFWTKQRGPISSYPHFSSIIKLICSLAFFSLYFVFCCCATLGFQIMVLVLLTR